MKETKSCAKFSPIKEIIESYIPKDVTGMARELHLNCPIVSLQFATIHLPFCQIKPYTPVRVTPGNPCTIQASSFLL